MMQTEMPYRAMVAGVSGLAPIVLRGTEYTGAYLSTMLSINPEQPASESGRTSQLIAEFGRLTAAAAKDKDMAEIRYRMWRDGQIHAVCTNLDAAKKAGFPKLAGREGAEEWTRTLSDYLDHQTAIANAAEVHATFMACLDAAKARARAVFAFERTGGSDHRAPSQVTPEDGGNGPQIVDGGREDEDDGGRSVLKAAEEEFARTPRTPLPPITGAPPPPPTGRVQTGAGRVPPPPPPPPAR